MTLSSYHLKISFFFILSFIFLSCDRQYNSIGYDLLSSNELNSKKFLAPVFVSEERIKDFQTNDLPIQQLGKLNHTLFGETTAQIISQLSISSNPIFGLNDQLREDLDNSSEIRLIQENEKIESVFLEIPFFSSNNDSDNDGVEDYFDSDPQNIESDSDNDGVLDYIETQNLTNPLSADTDGDGINDLEDTDNSVLYPSENSVYKVDSIFGNKSASFDFKVYELKYFLNSLDPNNNFESNINYFSSQDFYENGFVGEILHDARIKLNLEEVRLNYQRDDSLTIDIDETKIIENRYSPRLRVPLNPAFFQKKILDNEGANELANQTNFSEFLRGLIIKMENPSDYLYMMLNFDNALIRINYSFDKYNTNATEDDISDDFIFKDYSSFILNTNGVKINNIKNNFTDNNFSENDSESKIILKGGLGSRLRLKLFDSDNSRTLIDSLRANQWLINEANLVFYVDQKAIENWKNKEIADRIFLYNLEKSLPITDYFSDISINSNSVNRNKAIYGGILEYDENNKPFRYKISLTDHIKELLISDQVDNIDLGVSITSNIQDSSFKRAIILGLSEEQFYPTSSILNPFGTVLIGINPEEELSDKKLELEIFYTDFSIE